jgi:hypothetical protein
MKTHGQHGDVQRWRPWMKSVRRFMKWVKRMQRVAGKVGWFIGLVVLIANVVANLPSVVQLILWLRAALHLLP